MLIILNICYGKRPYSLLGQELDEKIDTTLMSVR